MYFNATELREALKLLQSSLKELGDEDIAKAEVAWAQARRQALHDLIEGVAFAVAGAGSGRASDFQGSPPRKLTPRLFPPRRLPG